MNKPQPDRPGATKRGPLVTLRCCPRCGLGLDELNPLTRAGYCKICVFELTFPPAVQARLIADGRGPCFVIQRLRRDRAGTVRAPLAFVPCPECGEKINRRGLGTHRASQHGVKRTTAVRLPKRSPHYDH